MFEKEPQRGGTGAGNEEREMTSRENIFLSGPEVISPGEQKEKEEGICFNFSSNTKEYSIGTKEGKSYLAITYFDHLPKELVGMAEKFIIEERTIGGEKKNIHLFKFGEVPKSDEKDEEMFPGIRKENFVDQPRDLRIYKENLPFRRYKETFPKAEKFNVKQLAEFLKEKRVLFYTGAGISRAAGVPTMDGLYKAMRIDFSKMIDGFLKDSIENPEKIIKAWKSFAASALESPPTPAHESVKTMAQKLNCQIFTENVDELQEKTGVEPIHLTVRGSWLKENIKKEWLKELDVVITVGLGRDDRGFLNWYKKHNPDGIIAAVNSKQPPYLDKKDILLKGDLQRTIPKLEEEILGTKKK